MSDIIGLGYRYLAFPILDLRRGTDSLKRFAAMEKSQWLDKEQIKKLQSRKLRKMIKHAYDNVPFYHRMFRELGLMPEDIKSKEDLCKLPLIDKMTVRKHFNDLKAKDFNKWRPVLRTTGGTTGSPLKYYSDHIELSVYWAGAWRVWNWAGYEIGDKKATIGGSKPSASGFNIRSFISSRILDRNLSLSSFDVKTDAMQHHVEKLHKFGPKIMRGYPSALYLFARYIEERQVGDLGIQSVITISEQLYKHQKRTIENAFGCEVFDNYGCPDGGAWACECEEHEYHLNSEDAVVEIVSDGEVVTPGEQGEIVTTNLSRFAMPLLRYRTGDMGIESDDDSKCGRGLEMLASVLGRTTDYFLLPDGNVLSGVSLAAVFNNISSQLHIKHYQVLQEKKDELDVLLVKDSGYSESDTTLIMKTLLEHMGSEMIINVKPVDEIPLTESGKRRSFVSKLKVDFT